MKVRINIEDYDYQLPKELIAKYPAQRREGSRLLILDRKEKKIQHRFFYQLPEYLKPGDLLVRNISKVIPARLYGIRERTGGKVEILPLEVSRSSDSVFPALVKFRGKLKKGEKILLPGDKFAVYLGKDKDVHKVKFDFPNLLTYLYKYGNVPLPPYIKRKDEESDRERYQTVYAQSPGSIAAPTAGLHFSSELIQNLKQKGVDFADLTLHISYATFKPLSEKELSSKKLHKEYFELSAHSASKINQAKKEKRRIIAIGTTSVRVLESQAELSSEGYKVKEGRGETALFIYPPYKFKIVDALITNFHLPRTSLLLLVSAFAGREFLLEAYQEAIQSRYRFFSYGDCMFIF